MRKYCFWSYPDIVYEVPDSFNMNDRMLDTTTVDVVVNKNGTKTIMALNHRVLAECLGRDCFQGAGCWKELS